jgi:hypothetical protein
MFGLARKERERRKQFTAFPPGFNPTTRKLETETLDTSLRILACPTRENKKY